MDNIQYDHSTSFEKSSLGQATFSACLIVVQSVLSSPVRSPVHSRVQVLQRPTVLCENHCVRFSNIELTHPEKEEEKKG